MMTRRAVQLPPSSSFPVLRRDEKREQDEREEAKVEEEEGQDAAVKAEGGGSATPLFISVFPEPSSGRGVSSPPSPGSHEEQQQRQPQHARQHAPSSASQSPSRLLPQLSGEASPSYLPSVSASGPAERYAQCGDLIVVIPTAPSPFPSSRLLQPDATASSSASPPPSSSSPRSSFFPSGRPGPSTGSALLHCGEWDVSVYSLSLLSCVARLRGHDACVEAVYRDEWCEQADLLITQTAAGSVYLWSLSTGGQLEQRLESKSAWLSALLMTRALLPLPLLQHVSELRLDDGAAGASAGSASVAGDSDSDADDLMEAGLTPAVCLYENQRFYPLLGWSQRLLPTDRPPLSNNRGTRARRREDFRLLPHWHWSGDWELQRDDRTDVDGWSYAVDFSNRQRRFAGFHRKAFIHSVRRRRWQRHRQYQAQPTPHALASATLDGYLELKQEEQSSAPPALSPSSRSGRPAPILSPTPIKTDSRRKAKASRSSSKKQQQHAELQLPDSAGIAPRRSSTPSVSQPDIASSASASLPPACSSPSPQSAQLPPTKRRSPVLMRSTMPVPSSSSASAGSASTPSSPSPSALRSVLSHLHMQPEFKQKLKRVLLSHRAPEGAAQQHLAAAAVGHHSAERPHSPSLPPPGPSAAVSRKSAELKSRKGSHEATPPSTSSSSSSSSPASVSASAARVSSSKPQQEMKEDREGRDTATVHTAAAAARQGRQPQQAQDEGAAQATDSRTPPRPAVARSPALPPVLQLSGPATRVECWENQRHYPVLGWSSRLLPTDPLPPFSDALGSHLFTFEMAELQLQLNEDWRSEWTPRVDARLTDSQGWAYALDWQWAFEPRSRVLSAVRRRCWQREKAVRMSGPSIDTPSSRRGRTRRTAGGDEPPPERRSRSTAARRRNSFAGAAGETASAEAAHSRTHSLFLFSRPALPDEAEPAPAMSSFYDPRAGAPEDL